MEKDDNSLVSITEPGSEVEVPKEPKRPRMFYFMRLFGFVNLVLLNVLANFQKTCPAVVAEDMALSYNVSKKSLGSFSASYYYPYGITQMMFDPAIVLGVFGLVSAGGSCLVGFSKTLWVGSLGRFLVGLGTGPTYVAALKMISNWYLKDQLPIALGINMAFSCVGELLSGSPLSIFCKKFGWRVAFHLFGGISGVLSLIVLIFTRGSPEKQGFDPVNPVPAVKPDESFCKKLETLFYNIWTVLCYGYFWVVVLFNVCTVTTFMNIAGLWAGPYLCDILGYSKTTRGNAMIALHIGVFIGSGILPPIAKWVKTKKYVLIFSAIFTFLPIFALYLHGDHVSYVMIWVYFTILGTFSRSVLSLDYPILTSYYTPLVSGSAVGIANFFLNFGVAVFQLISTDIIPRYGSIPTSSDVDMYTWEGYKNGLWLFSSVCASVAILMGIIMKDPDDKLCNKVEKTNNDVLAQSLLLDEVQKPIIIEEPQAEQKS